MFAALLVSGWILNSIVLAFGIGRVIALGKEKYEDDFDFGEDVRGDVARVLDRREKDDLEREDLAELEP